MNIIPNPIIGRLALWCLIAAVLMSIPSAMAQDAALPSQRALDSKAVQLLERAAAYHDLAILYIRKADPDKAVAEARQILALPIPADQEHLVVKSLAIISDKLAEARRFDLAQTLLDEALKAAALDGSKAKVLKTKARLYLLANDDDKAIESYRRALELEPRPLR